MLADSDALEADHPVPRLRKLIADGGYAPGSRLPAERELTNELGVTRSTLRKALDRLEREGAIWRHVGKGTFVAADTNGSVPSVGSLAEISRQMTPVRMMRARLVIEPAICREAAINASDHAMMEMNLAMDRAHSATNWHDYETQDDHFHRAIAEASDNLLLLALFDQLNQVRRAVAWGSVIRRSEKPAADHLSFREHEAIAAAISKRDPHASFEAMRNHLRSVTERLFGEG